MKNEERALNDELTRRYEFYKDGIQFVTTPIAAVEAAMGRVWTGVFIAFVACTTSLILLLARNHAASTKLSRHDSTELAVEPAREDTS